MLGSLDEIDPAARRRRRRGLRRRRRRRLVREQTFAAAAVAPLIADARAIPNVDYVLPAYSDVAVAVNLDKRAELAAVQRRRPRPAASRDLPDIESVERRQRCSLDRPGAGRDLRQRERRRRARRQGRRLDHAVSSAASRRAFTVKAIVKDRRLAGAGGISTRREGGVMPLAAAQELLRRARAADR